MSWRGPSPERLDFGRLQIRQTGRLQTVLTAGLANKGVGTLPDKGKRSYDDANERRTVRFDKAALVLKESSLKCIRIPNDLFPVKDISMGRLFALLPDGVEWSSGNLDEGVYGLRKKPSRMLRSFLYMSDVYYRCVVGAKNQNLTKVVYSFGPSSGDDKTLTAYAKEQMFLLGVRPEEVPDDFVVEPVANVDDETNTAHFCLVPADMFPDCRVRVQRALGFLDTRFSAQQISNVYGRREAAKHELDDEPPHDHGEDPLGMAETVLSYRVSFNSYLQSVGEGSGAV